MKKESAQEAVQSSNKQEQDAPVACQDAANDVEGPAMWQTLAGLGSWG